MQTQKKIDLVLIEENLQQRNNISSRLRTQGFIVDAPSGGFHAIKVIEEHAVQAAILCSDMDDMSLYEVATLIRSIPDKNGMIPLILFTSPESYQEVEHIANNIDIYQFISDQNFSQLATCLKKLTKV